MNAATSQREWVQWIWAQPAALPPAGLRPVGPLPLQQGLAAYREHAKALVVRALGAAYPMLAQWLGQADFAGMAWAFAKWQPPQVGDMNQFGAELAQFLEGLPGMDPEPPVLARLEWHLHALASAQDDSEADPQLWTALQTQDPSSLRLGLSPSLAVFEIPESVRDWLGERVTVGLSSVGTHAIAWRRAWLPVWSMTDLGLATLLQGLMSGETLAHSIEGGLALNPSLDLTQFFQTAAQEGWLLTASPESV